jgi:hypothetical protein
MICQPFLGNQKIVCGKPKLKVAAPEVDCRETF